MVQLTSKFLALIALFSTASSLPLAQALAVDAHRDGTSVMVDSSIPGPLRVDVDSPALFGTRSVRAGQWTVKAPNDDNKTRAVTKSFSAIARSGASVSRAKRVASRLFNLPLPAQLQLGHLGNTVLGLLSGESTSQKQADKRFFNSRVAGRRNYSPLYDAAEDFDASDDSNVRGSGKDSTGVGGDINALPGSEPGFADDDNSSLVRRTFMVNSTSLPTLVIANVNTTNGTYVVHPFVGTTIISSSNSTHHRRSEDMRTRVPGTMEIMSPVYGSDEGVRLASLYLTRIAGDGTSASEYQLDASSHNHTQMYLTIAEPTVDTMSIMSNVESSKDVPVNIQMDVFDQNHATMASWCATYDPSPDGSANLNVEPCHESDEHDTHKSQMFLWNKETSAVKPMFWAGQDSSDALSAEGMDTANITAPPYSTTTSSSATPTLTSASLDETKSIDATANAAKAFVAAQNHKDDSDALKDSGLNEKVKSFQSTYTPNASHPPLGARADATPQNVTLVFRPDAPKVASFNTSGGSAALSSMSGSASSLIMTGATSSMTSSSNEVSASFSAHSSGSLSFVAAEATSVTVSTASGSISASAPSTTLSSFAAAEASSSSFATSSSLSFSITLSAAEASTTSSFLASSSASSVSLQSSAPSLSAADAGSSVMSSVSSSSAVSPAAPSKFATAFKIAGVTVGPPPSSSSMMSSPTSSKIASPSQDLKAASAAIVGSSSDASSTGAMSFKSSSTSVSTSSIAPSAAVSSSAIASTTLSARALAAPSMIAVSTEPYTWRFRADRM